MSSAITLKESFFALIALAQSIGRISSTRSVALSVVTSGSYSIAGEPVINTAGASLSGFIKVLAAESPNIQGNIIDISPMRHAPTSAALAREILSSPDNDVVALRYSTRWLQTFDPIPMSSPVIFDHPEPQVGAYLITGGLGGLGLVFAEELARSNVGANFVLVGRSSVPPDAEWASMLDNYPLDSSEARRIRGLLRVRAAGAKVATLQADVSDAKSMREIVSWCNDNFGSVRGVIHAAGVPSHSMVLTKTHEEALKVFESKVDGTRWIEDLLTSFLPNFVLLCSSMSAVVPSPGLSDYATANAYLDAFASKHDNLHGTRVISVNWDTWTDIGMAVDLVRQRGLNSVDQAGITHAITAQEGASVLHRVLHFPGSQVVVSTRDLGLLLEMSNILTAQAATIRPDATSDKHLHSRPEISQSYVEPVDEIEHAISEIWKDLLGIERVGRFDNFFELGGHSLLGTQVMARIRQRFGLDLPLRTVFEASTPSDLAKLLRAIPWATGLKDNVPVTDEDREEIEL